MARAVQQLDVLSGPCMVGPLVVDLRLFLPPTSTDAEGVRIRARMQEIASSMRAVSPPALPSNVAKLGMRPFRFPDGATQCYLPKGAVATIGADGSAAIRFTEDEACSLVFGPSVPLAGDGNDPRARVAEHVDKNPPDIGDTMRGPTARGRHWMFFEQTPITTGARTAAICQSCAEAFSFQIDVRPISPSPAVARLPARRADPNTCRTNRALYVR